MSGTSKKLHLLGGCLRLQICWFLTFEKLKSSFLGPILGVSFSSTFWWKAPRESKIVKSNPVGSLSGTTYM